MFRAEPVSVAGLADWQRPAFDDVRSGNTGAFMTAMTFYAEGRDAEAEEELGRHLASATEPDPLARFYRAAVRVELGRLEDARDDLLVAAEHATGNLRDATLWNLANVHLMLEDADAALAALDDLAARDGRFRALAAELAGEVRATAR